MFVSLQPEVRPAHVEAVGTQEGAQRGRAPHMRGGREQQDSGDRRAAATRQQYTSCVQSWLAHPPDRGEGDQHVGLVQGLAKVLLLLLLRLLLLLLLLRGKGRLQAVLLLRQPAGLRCPARRPAAERQRRAARSLAA